MAQRGRKAKTETITWSPSLAYVIGLLASDGSLSNDGRHISFVSKDIQQVENMKKCLRLGVKTGTHVSGRKNGGQICYKVQWGDVTFYRFLKQIGLTPNKSLTLGVLAVPDDLFFHFLRGVFDGDGSFYSYFDSRWKRSLMFYLDFPSASRAHVLWLQASLSRLAGVRGHLTAVHQTGKKRPMFHVRFAKKETLQIVRRMYQDEEAACLTRKRLKIRRALRIVGESLIG